MLVHLNFAVTPRLFRIVQGLTTGIYLLADRPQRAQYLCWGFCCRGSRSR